MGITSLATYLQAVDERLKQWTARALNDLPGFPPRPDTEELAKTAWFRGHCESGWRLIPSIFRIEGYTLEREVAMNLAFLNSSSRLGDPMPSKDDFPAWLSKMQHHGMPTRLLDWTDNPTIGLYFALRERANYTRWRRPSWFTPVVWMVNPHALNWISTGGSIVPTTSLNELAGNYRNGWTRAWGCQNVFPAFGITGENVYEGPMAVRPVSVDPRMHAQRSRFTIHGARPEPIDGMFRATPERDIEKRGLLDTIPVEPAAADDIARELRRIGVTPSTVFPDIDGLAMEAAESF